YTMLKQGLLTCLMILLLSSCNTLKIIDKPVTYDQERKQLSLDYLEKRYGIIKNEPTIEPRRIVVHWTAIPGLEKSFDAFKQSKLPS
ncbi:MAG: N-acetylmuramoyl-L-alanine amidase, partial [Lutimonas sp.]